MEGEVASRVNEKSEAVVPAGNVPTVKSPAPKSLAPLFTKLNSVPRRKRRC